MNTYQLITIQESTIIGTGMASTSFQIPIDQNGNTPVDYQHKNRVIIDNTSMIVFDTEQEYKDWVDQNT